MRVISLINITLHNQELVRFSCLITNGLVLIGSNVVEWLNVRWSASSIDDREFQGSNKTRGHMPANQVAVHIPLKITWLLLSPSERGH